MTSLNDLYGGPSGSGGGMRWVTPPTAADSPGNAGDMAYDGQYLYLCYAQNSWMRFGPVAWGAGSAPSNYVAPALSGTLAFGQTITCSTGSWSGSPTSYAYAWLVNGVHDPSLGSANSIVVSVANELDQITCRVTATNAYGSVAANSNTVTFPQATPSNIITPTLSGLAEVGAVLSCSTGTWLYAPDSYAYAWFVDDVLDAGLGTASTLTVPPEVGGHVVKCRVTATNEAGSASVFSNSRTITSDYTAGADFSDDRNSMYAAITAGF